MPDDALIGYPLDTFTDVLPKVEPRFDADPVSSFEPWDHVEPWVREYVLDMGHPEDVRFMRIHTQLRIKAFETMPFDLMCMLHHSGSSYMADAVRARREHDPRWAILYKIKSSAWQWTSGTSGTIGWNDTVDAHASIRSFDIAVDGFKTTLDWTRGTNPRGTGVGSKTWLDGTFAFLIHHRDRHVMTIGFSITADRRVLIQQIQNTSRRGNRWLFSFPSNRVEHVLDRIVAAFAGFTVMLADGGDVAGFSLKSYRDELRQQTGWRRNHAVALRDGVGDADYHRRMRAAHSQEAKAAAVKIAHLKAEMPRLNTFYADAGRYRRGAVVTSHGLRHYEMAA